MVKGKNDFMSFFGSAEGMDEEGAKNCKGFHLNYVKDINAVIVLGCRNLLVCIDEKLVPFFKDQNFEVESLEDGTFFALKNNSRVISDTL